MKHLYNQIEEQQRARWDNKKPSITLKLFCFVMRKKMVKLTDFEGETFFSYLLPNCACGKLHTYVHWFTHVGDCTLNPDGTIAVESFVSWTKKWEYM